MNLFKATYTDDTYEYFLAEDYYQFCDLYTFHLRPPLSQVEMLDIITHDTPRAADIDEHNLLKRLAGCIAYTKKPEKPMRKITRVTM